MSRPVIGITTSCGPDPNDKPGNERLYVNRLYADCVLAAGGVPVLLTKQTPVEEALEIVDGLLIPGGDDIDARHFGQDNHPMVKLEDPERFPYEKALLDAWPASAPVLGICYGCQAMNLQRGGDMVQHLPDVVPDSPHTGGAMQEYRIEPDSKLSRIVGTTKAKGKSYHHQANDRAGSGLRVVARAEDGTVEAIEDESERWFIGVQWHPERTPEDPASVRLFRSLVQAAAEFREKRQR